MKPFRFAEHRGQIRKVLVIELLGLGDNVHLLPALFELRAALPDAELHVMSRAHVADLFSVTPWVDRVWRYPVIPRKPSFAEHRRLIAQLRAEHFDLVINSSSNDRSSWLTGLSGAPRRVGRIPRKGRLLHWRLMHNLEIATRYSDRPTWQQKLEAFRAAGIPALEGPRFHVQPAELSKVDVRVRALASRPYLHVSPFASEDRRGLRDAAVAEMLNALHALQPPWPIVVSLGPTPREARKWQAVLQQLQFTPAAVFAGDLDTVSFLRLVAGAALHIGPDSGGVHVARMFAVPTVSWIRQHGGTREWIADEPGSHAFVSQQHDEQGVTDISAGDIAAAAARVASRLPKLISYHKTMSEPSPLSIKSPRKHSLSVMVIACNEADRLDACLQSVAGWADEIVLLDSGSRDETVAIARRYTDQVYETDWPGYGAQFQRALERTHGEYVFALDADERMTPELREEIDRCLSVDQPLPVAWRLRWAFWFLGSVVRHGRFESPQTKLYRREGLSWPSLTVHPAPLLPPGPVGFLQSRLEHHSFRNLRHAYDKYSEYAWLIAQQKHAAGKRATPGKALLRGVWEFVAQYFLRGLWLEGRRGLQLAFLMTHYAFLKYAYLASLGTDTQPPHH